MSPVTTADQVHDPLPIYLPEREPFLDPQNTGLPSRGWLLWARAVTLNLTTQPDILHKTHADRLTTDIGLFPDGTLAYETDRDVLYVVNAGKWHFLTGIFCAVQANAPTDLGLDDADFLMYVSDFHHLVMWTGTKWQFGPGDDGAAYYRNCQVEPTPTIGWTLADGRPSSYLRPDTQLYVQAFVTPNLTATAPFVLPYFRR